MHDKRSKRLVINGLIEQRWVKSSNEPSDKMIVLCAMKILISGGSGLVGSLLIAKLVAQGNAVINLTTKKNLKSYHPQIVQSYWNPSTGEFNASEVNAFDAVINLAGYNVSNRWTKETKEVLVSSRINSTNLLIKICEQAEKKPQTFISTSASGYYRSSTELQHEEAKAGQGFLSDLTLAWENATMPAVQMGMRRVILRVGVVLDQNDGALAKMVPFFKLGLGSATGSGEQYMSWIHLDDLVNLYIHALEKNIEGTFNANAPGTCTNAVFSKALAKALDKPFFFPNVPAFALKLLFGEMSSMLVNSQRISSEKIAQTGFKFQYPQIDAALNEIYS